jgi:hypothetical protein
MSVPLDRLYNFLHDVCNHRDLIIYRFFPHGSRKITDLKRLNAHGQASEKTKKFMIFYDQEPLNFDLYTDVKMVNEILENPTEYSELSKEVLTPELYEKYINFLQRVIVSCNIKLIISSYMHSVPVILVHSEQRSKNLQRYQEHEFITVYWWCHAMIARDWFRYAEIDPLLNTKQVKKEFLIYNRAWSGTREYRLKFAELLIENNLTDYCHMGFNSDDEGDYRNHQFINHEFQIKHNNLENYFHLNTTSSAASADYVATDYQSINVEVVLETLFDDDRIQLTEKILRPIACGQPFMLAATHGSLEYLRSYGFETFAPWIDETYDTIENPAQRLEAIVQEMSRITNLSKDEKTLFYAGLKDIAIRNKQLFFSDAWQQQIVDEYQINFEQAFQALDQRLKEKFKKFNLF